ncbi:hypothetical protein [Ramlibacter sp. WS9]|uniref:hypothetical protein n=1 Tax=Ramlibacter sp. WS9 TaxID=1882741 RepID=UPI001305304F|nr:hypothetical protein [Ramlibacter sp. WS9]
MKDSTAGMAASADFFAIRQQLFRAAKKVRLELEADEFASLSALARERMAATGSDAATLDLIVRSPGEWHAFWSDEPLKRLSGGDDSRTGAHRKYIDLEPLLDLANIEI